jgi:hypothetical protein
MQIAEPRIRRRVVWGVIGCGVCLSAYWLAAFLNTFEVFGLPVRNNHYGWLGPTPRTEEQTSPSKGCTEDIGKVNFWVCEDISVFKRHRFGCAVWLKLNGFDIGPW